MQQPVLLNAMSTSVGQQRAICPETAPLSLTWTDEALMKGGELLRDQLLATKFFVPVSSHTLIPRPRLMALLNACPRRPLTLVSAPAGFGKTTLLSEWVQSMSRESIQVAWISLDEEDNDLVRFWRYVLTALDALQPGMCTDLVNRLRTQMSPHLPLLLTTLINRLVQIPEQILLVLDDYHMITDQEVHTSFTSLVEHLPAQLRVVLSTRVDPPFPLSRLRARSQLLEVRTEQLRCSETEIADILREIVGIELSENGIQQVMSRTGGWLAGLRMLDISLQRCEGSSYLQDEVISSHHHIVDYLTEEVLRQQSPAIQHFLLRTSILERLTAPLCDAVLEQSGSQQVLEELKRANLFLISLDSQRCWYRYHPLFAEALSFLLERVDPEVIKMLHLRASGWYAEQGYFDEAIEHAMRAQAWQKAADFIEAEMRTSNEKRWEPAILQHWLEQLPQEVMHAHPNLCFAYTSAQLPLDPASTVEALMKTKDDQVSPTGSERMQPVQVEIVQSQAKSCAALKRSSSQSPPQQDLLDPLSVRELEVLQLMAQGATNQEIARALTLATETIKRHVSNIISKLEVCNRTQAVVRGHSLGLLSDDLC